MPTTKLLVRRSRRIYNMVEFLNKTPSDQRLQPSLGSFQGTIFVRQKILNPKTGRLVYEDGVIGKAILNKNLKKEEKEGNIRQKIINPKTGRLVYVDGVVGQGILHNHLGDTIDAMDVSLDDFSLDIHLGDTILAKTIKINRLENTIPLPKEEKEEDDDNFLENISRIVYKDD